MEVTMVLMEPSYARYMTTALVALPLDAPLLPFSIVRRKLISPLAFSRCPRATHHEMIKSGFNFQVLHGRRRSEALNLKWTDLIERPHVA
jgi:hypothetical protein